MLEAVLPYGLPVKGWCFALNRKAKNNKEFKSNLHISFIFIPWIRTGLQNPYGYGNSHICLRILEVKSM
jgi:hypothetical protein